MLLAINTAQPIHELALINKGELLAERAWPKHNKDLEELIPTLQKMLEELGLTKQEITEILVITGPGSFTSVRTGVSFANALAAGLSAKLFAINTFELLERKAATAPIITILHAGGQDVAVRSEGETKVGPIAQLLAPFEHNKFSVVAEVLETQADELHSICLEKNWPQIQGEKLQTLGESILTFDLQNLKPIQQAEPIYLKQAI